MQEQSMLGGKMNARQRKKRIRGIKKALRFRKEWPDKLYMAPWTEDGTPPKEEDYAFVGRAKKGSLRVVDTETGESLV